MKYRFVALTVLLLLPACSGKSSSLKLPTKPTTPTTPAEPTTPIPALNGANWVGDATVVSLLGEGCGSMSAAARSGILWKITETGSSVTLDQDMRSYPTDDVPYVGTLSGTHFTAKYVPPQQSGGGCVFQGGDLSGSFSEDGLRWNAVETNVWIAAGNEVKLQRYWTATRF